MKTLILLSLLSLIGCGGSSSSDSSRQEQTVMDARRCGYQLDCIAQSDYFFVSSKPLPKKIKLTLAQQAADPFEYINECTKDWKYTIERGNNYGRILVVGIRGFFYESTDVEIQNCENGDVFFSENMIPEVKTSPDDRDKAYFFLNN